MSNIKVCPHCGSKQFMAHIIRGCLVESDGVDEKGEPTFKIIKEGAKNRYELEVICCSNCKHDVTAKDLVSGVQCKNCGEYKNPDELDENGNCEVCAMLLANPQLQDASQDDLLRLLARAMKGMKPDTSLVDKKQEQAAKIEAPTMDTSNNTEEPQEEMISAADAILNGNTPSDVVASKPRKKRTVKRATELQPVQSTKEPASEEAPKPEENSETTAEEEASAVESVSDVQDAPFPDVPTIPEIPQQQEQTAESSPPFPDTQVGVGFQMFDSGDDEEPF